MDARIINRITTFDGNQNVLSILISIQILHDIPEVGSPVISIQRYDGSSTTMITAAGQKFQADDLLGIIDVIPNVLPVHAKVVQINEDKIFIDFDGTQIVPYQSGGKIFKCLISTHNYLLNADDISAVVSDKSGTDLVISNIAGNYAKLTLIPKLQAEDIIEQKKLTQTTQEDKRIIDISNIVKTLSAQIKTNDFTITK